MNSENIVEDNQYIKYYGENNISPVHQDISNFNLHLFRREKLYIILGMPNICFNGRDVLEIGPGGGYNALAYFKWNANMDFVEPNKKAQEEIPKLYQKYSINKYNLFKGKFEDYNVDKKYDIIIAEGFIPLLSNRIEIMNKIFSYLKPGGVGVVTCVDDISYFFEYLRKIIAIKLCRLYKVDKFDEKNSLLVKAFERHYKTLKYASRPVEDWVADNLMNPYSFGDLFTVGECIDAIPEGYDILGCSPDLFTNYQWYKDYEYNDKQNCKEQFYRKHHNLIMTGMTETSRNGEKNKELIKLMRGLRNIIDDNNDKLNDKITDSLIELLNNIIGNLDDIDSCVTDSIKEAVKLIKDPDLTIEKVSGAGAFAAAFGRGQQYVSIVKRFVNDMKGI